MKLLSVMSIIGIIAISAALAGWLMHRPAPPSIEPKPGVAPGLSGPAIRLGLTPESDIFTLRKRYQTLATYLEAKLGRPVELVTANSYQSVLEDLADKQIDGAFLGSFIAELAVDRLGAKVLVKPQLKGGDGYYRGIIFVRDDSPIRSIDDLAGHSLAMVRATSAAHLFPVSQMVEHHLFQGPGTPPRFVWVGTHDQVIKEVMSGQADAGAVKSTRLEGFEQVHSAIKLRHLATSPPVPEIPLVLRADVPESLAKEMRAILTSMANEPAGRAALETFGAVRFVDCPASEFAAIREMVAKLAGQWERMDLPLPRPATNPEH